ncbi:MAG: flagellar FliJ family protein [SAR324 cluster bacterium]|nr:flagellar FliJ family protein [SAR324 cluster bacterium]
MKESSLEQLYRYYKSVASQDMLALAKVNRQRQNCIMLIENIQTEVLQSRINLQNMWNSGSVVGQHLRLQTEYENEQMDKISKVKHQIENLDNDIKINRDILIKSTTKVKTFEILKKAHKKRLSAKLKKIESNMLDEAASRQFINRSNNNFKLC